MRTSALKCNRSEITCRQTFFGHTHLAVVRHIKTVDRAAFTCRRKYLNNIFNIAARNRCMTFCQTHALTDDLSLFVHTASILGQISRYNIIRNLIGILFKLSIVSHAGNFPVYFKFNFINICHKFFLHFYLLTKQYR